MVIGYTALYQNVLLGVAAFLGAAALRQRILHCRELNSKPYQRAADLRRARAASSVVACSEPVASQEVDADYVAYQLEIAKRKRRMKQADEAKEQMASFLLTAAKKLRQRAASLPLTDEQRQDFDYHMQGFIPEGCTQRLVAQSLEALTAACQAIGVNLEAL
ncbi:hypothetical protein KBI23_08355 [bacterium]|nr:hypothetical protein [bacterium]